MGEAKGRCRLVCGLLLATALSVVWVAPAAADTNLVIGGQGVVAHTNGDGVNFRTSTNFSSDVIKVLPDGTTVKVLDGPQDAAGIQWYHVDYDGSQGWIDSDYLAQSGSSGGSGGNTAASGTLTVSGTNGDGLRLRESPGGTVLTVMPEGASVTVVGPDKSDGSGAAWANIGYKGTNGFASREYLAAGATAAAPATVAVAKTAAPAPAPAGLVAGDNAEVVNTNGDGLNLRYDASFSSGVQAVAPEGSVVHVVDGPKNDGSTAWFQVDYAGVRGWMSGAFLTKTDKQPSQATASKASTDTSQQAPAAPAASSVGQQIASTALKYLGTPYVWAGTTPAGFDCSGFVYYVVNKVIGGGFPRDMESQAASGSYVAQGNLQPGDLVFFQNTYKFGLSHAGIYIGDGQFVNAANESTGVIISSMHDSYWASRYYTARRIGG